MFDDPWGGITLLDELRRDRTRQPREAGLTMIIDCGLGLRETADVLEVSGGHIDLWKLSFGTSVFVPMKILIEKIALINARGILSCPGGTLFEAAIVQQHCHDFMHRAVGLGFTAVEISDGTITLPPDRRRRTIDCAAEAGLTVVTEVGKKDPRAQPPPEALAEQAILDLSWGAEHVIVEGRESGIGVGIFDDSGKVSMAAVEVFATVLGDRADRLIWEAPQKSQQTALIQRFGQNVSLGNIDPRQVLAVEALRAGLRFETLKPIAESLHRSGQWQPEQPEAAPGQGRRERT
jgi:phosphosulfolactate synthase